MVGNKENDGKDVPMDHENGRAGYRSPFRDAMEIYGIEGTSGMPMTDKDLTPTNGFQVTDDIVYPKPAKHRKPLIKKP